MNKIEEYLGGLLPNFEKSRMQGDLRLLREQLSDITLPAMQTANEYFKESGLSSDMYKELDGIAQKRVDGYKDSLINTITKALEHMSTNLTSMADLVDKSFDENIAREALSITRINILRYIEVANFFNGYSRRLLLTLINVEKKGVKGLDKSEVREYEWLMKNRDAFLVAINGMLVENKEVEKEFEKVPDILATPEVLNNAKSVVGVNKLDPFKFRLIPLIINPIYHLRMAYTNWQVAQYKLAKEEKVALELKLLNLKQHRSGKVDPKLEKTIGYTEERIQDLRYKIKKIEEE